MTDKEKIRRNYDRMSGSYDIIAGVWERRFRNRGLDFLSASEGETILEIGFATGSALVKIGRAAGENGNLCGIDLSPAMRKKAIRKLSRAKIKSKVELKTVSATSIPCPDNTFDGIFASFVIEILDETDIAKTLSECARVLKKDGRLITVTMRQPKKPRAIDRLYKWAARKFPDKIDCRPIDIKSFLEKAGFVVEKSCVMKMCGLGVDIVRSKP
jgi:demethylmenaquinone methyltransferase/2-methoxy-6-polyprenyl-1,4-benzoquinol methylase